MFFADHRLSQILASVKLGISNFDHIKNKSD